MAALEDYRYFSPSNWASTWTCWVVLNIWQK
jgi:hypothetical protein